MRPPSTRKANLKSAVRSFEREHILQALRRNGSDKVATARDLNIGLSSLYRKMDELDVAKNEPRSDSAAPMHGEV